MAEWIRAITGLTVTTVAWFTKITPSAEQTHPHHHGKFSRGTWRLRAISAPEHERMDAITPLCLSGLRTCLVWSESRCGEQYWKTPFPAWWRWITRNYSIGPRAREWPPRLRELVALFVATSVGHGWASISCRKGGWEHIILIVTPPFAEMTKHPISARV